MALQMDCFGLTDIGRERKSNQDQYLIGDLRKSLEVFRTSLSMDNHTRLFGGSQGKLLLVADGMGGYSGGERASTLAIDSLADYLLNTLQWFYQLEEDGEEDFVDELKTALEKCQQSIVAEGEVIPARQGMGTTLTVAYVVWPRLYVVHAGGTRCYLYRDSKLRQITKDHTIAQQFVEAGVLREKDASESRWSHVLWNSLGCDDEVQPEAYRAELTAGDVLLLCSDGLTKHVTDTQIEQWLVRSEKSEITCRQLVDAANQAGGTDNITVVIARFLRAGEHFEQAEQRAVLADRIDQEEPSDTTDLCETAALGEEESSPSV